MFGLPENWRKRPEYLLMLMAAAMPLSFWAWMVLLNNFTIEVASFTGREIGILQSLREIPGFLSFLVVYFADYCRTEAGVIIADFTGDGGSANRLFPYRYRAIYHHGYFLYRLSLL